MRVAVQQRKFTSLDGATEASGDLKVRACCLSPGPTQPPHPRPSRPAPQSVVLHNMELKHSKSTFPMSLGARITCVDDKTYASTGEAYSTVRTLLPSNLACVPPCIGLGLAPRSCRLASWHFGQQ